jgi:hypothetical protein
LLADEPCRASAATAVMRCAAAIAQRRRSRVSLSPTTGGLLEMVEEDETKMLKHFLQKILKHFQKTLINILTKNIGESILEKCESNVFCLHKSWCDSFKES